MTREERYPCATPGCPVIRTKGEGGEIFTLCDKCWHADQLNRAAMLPGVQDELDAARAELARIRPVYERALEWAGASCSRMPNCDPYDGSHDAECLNSIADARLYSAIDHARSSSAKGSE